MKRMRCLLQYLNITLNSPQQCIGCSIHDAFYPKALHGTQAHEARFQGHVKRAIQHAPVAVVQTVCAMGGCPQAFKLRMRTCVSGGLDTIAPRCQDLTLARYEDGAYRDLAGREGCLRLDQRQPHEAFIGVIKA
eukprot:evm.model.NODE_2639_length_36550_cov_21.569138.5